MKQVPRHTNEHIRATTADVCGLKVIQDKNMVIVDNDIEPKCVDSEHKIDKRNLEQYEDLSK